MPLHVKIVSRQRQKFADAEPCTAKPASNNTSKPAKPKKNKPAVGNIYKTTDGYFNNKENVKKTRRVAVIDQRKDDGALAVVKIYGKNGKTQTHDIMCQTLHLNPKTTLH